MRLVKCDGLLFSIAFLSHFGIWFFFFFFSHLHWRFFFPLQFFLNLSFSSCFPVKFTFRWKTSEKKICQSTMLYLIRIYTLIFSIHSCLSGHFIHLFILGMLRYFTGQQDQDSLLSLKVQWNYSAITYKLIQAKHLI